MKKPPKKNRAKPKQNAGRARRQLLERAITRYFASLDGEALKYEQRLEAVVGHAASQVNFEE